MLRPPFVVRKERLPKMTHGASATATLAIVIGLTAGLAGCSSMPMGRARIVKAAPRCVDQTVQIYFEPGAAEVTKEGRAVLAAAAAQSKPCKVVSVEVLGLADASGGADASLE